MITKKIAIKPYCLLLHFYHVTILKKETNKILNDDSFFIH